MMTNDVFVVENVETMPKMSLKRLLAVINDSHVPPTAAERKGAVEHNATIKRAFEKAREIARVQKIEAEREPTQVGEFRLARQRKISEFRCVLRMACLAQDVAPKEELVSAIEAVRVASLDVAFRVAFEEVHYHAYVSALKTQSVEQYGTLLRAALVAGLTSSADVTKVNV
jgi:hypothetical protein